MIFSPALAEAILDGRKTVTRRPVKSLQPCRYQEGRDYAIQPGRGKRAIARLTVLSVELQPLSDVLSGEEAHLEGFRHSDLFVRRWYEMYGNFDPDQAVWRIEFEVEGER